MSANNLLETFKIFTTEENRILTFVINPYNICETYYKNTHLFGSILYKTNNSIIILWKHLSHPRIREYIKKDQQNYYIGNTQSTIPSDWDPDNYRHMNPDVSKACKTDAELFKHYLEFGIAENRIFRTKSPLPDDFSPKTYRMLNPDLANFDDHRLKTHYLDHGIQEKRTYKLIVEKNTNPKCNPIFINHDCSLTGAPIFLYDYVTYLKNYNIIKNPIIIEACPNNIFDNYDIDKLYHDGDPNKLLDIIKKINPIFIYSNSLSLYYYYSDKYKDYWYKTYFHFHETLDNVNMGLLSKIRDQKILVVADSIKQEYETVGCSNISIFPPFIPQEKIFRIQSLSSKPQKNHTNNNKITIGMGGQISDRKNFGLFYKLAIACPDYEFLWVGGDKDWKSDFHRLYNHEPEILDNFTHVPYTKNPYPYFSNLDYFFLTSKNDPCPIVVLENLILDNRVIVIKDHIFYQHDKSVLKENLIEIKTNSEDKIIEEFKSLKLEKYHKNSNSSKYIKERFAEPKLISTIKNQNKQNYLIFSIYQGSRDNDTELAYFINLINHFNINNEGLYKVFINVNIDNGYDTNLSNDKYEFFFTKYKQVFKNIINLEHIELSPNIGYDINGLLKLVNLIYTTQDTDNTDTRIAYLHNKRNLPWREELNNIFYLKDTDIKKHDTIVCDKFFIDCRYDDLNREFMKKDKIFKSIANKNFKFIAGTIFITKLVFLKKLFLNYKYFNSKLTNMNTVSSLWISAMKDQNIFDKYYNHFLSTIYGDPMDIDSKTIIEQQLAFNFIDLYSNFSKRGIPDLHFEHSLERYIGYLITQNRNTKTV